MNMFILWMATSAEATTMVPLSMDQMVDHPAQSYVVRSPMCGPSLIRQRTRFGRMHRWKWKVFKGNLTTDLVVEQLVEFGGQQKLLLKVSLV